MQYTAILSALGLGPKTLDQARGTLAEAATTLNSVSALFTAAGLNLEAMLAAGPDSLKAHLDGLTAKDGELATAQAKVAELEGSLATATASLNTATQRFEFNGGLLSSIGFTVGEASTEADAKAAFDSHVKQAAALVLAKAGHDPVKHVAEQLAAKSMSRAEFNALPPHLKMNFATSGGKLTE